jgi:hypothetical protein
LAAGHSSEHGSAVVAVNTQQACITTSVQIIQAQINNSFIAVKVRDDDHDDERAYSVPVPLIF